MPGKNLKPLLLRWVIVRRNIAARIRIHLRVQNIAFSRKRKTLATDRIVNKYWHAAPFHRAV